MQKTDSAVDKPNLKQQFTEPSQSGSSNNDIAVVTDSVEVKRESV